MKVAISADHAGFELKQELTEVIKTIGFEVLDLGADTYDATDDYPDFAARIAEAIIEDRAERGILICGSGVGASIAANKFHGIRAGNVTDTYSAHQGVEHDQMNVLVLGARVVGMALAQELVKAFLAAEFSGEDRHVRRLNKISMIERGGLV